MGDDFLRAFEADLEKTQRLLQSNCLFCVPQTRSLVADHVVSQEDLYTHFLTPAGTTSGEYDTLNGKMVSIVGSHVFTGKGFEEKRKVRILLSETRQLHHQDVMVLHLSRPLVGGIALPEDPSEIDVATFRRYTAILRAFPENELVFYQLDETIAQVQKICRQHQFFNRYEETLPALLREEWEAAVEEIVNGGSFEDENENSEQQHHQSHLLQIQQVVECYLMEKLHPFLFPRVMVSCREHEEKLQSILYQMRHYTPEDFGIQKDFQVLALQARDKLIEAKDKKTPLDMLLSLKSCMDIVNDAIMQNLKQHHMKLSSYQMTTDDLLDQLLFIIVQAYNHTSLLEVDGLTAGIGSGNGTEEDDMAKTLSASPFPIAAVLKYISDYHFINSNTTALGFTTANFQVAIEYFLIRASHIDDCKACQDARDAGPRWSENALRSCPQGITVSNCEQTYYSNRRDIEKVMKMIDESDCNPVCSTTPGEVHQDSMSRLLIIGDWSSDDSVNDDMTTITTPASNTNGVHSVEIDVETRKLIQVSGGQRFFAAVDDQGKLYTWGDRCGGRLGYPSVDGQSRRVDHPKRVTILDQEQIVHVSCGAFHTLATDVNGHIFTWGSNSHGQLGFLTPAVASTIVETPTLVADLRGTYMNSVACGEYHSLGLSSDGRVYSWGCNKYFKLGRYAEGFLDAVQPRPVEANWIGFELDMKKQCSAQGGGVRRIAAGKDHSLAVSSDGAVFTWGRGNSGQLGHGCCMDVGYPKQVMAIAPSSDGEIFSVVDIAGGNEFSLFLLENGIVLISGRDPSLELDDNSYLTPHLLSLPSNLAVHMGKITTIACGEVHYALLTADGTLLLSSNERVGAEMTDAGSSTAEAQQRHVEKFMSTEPIHRMTCGASHTLVVI